MSSSYCRLFLATPDWFDGADLQRVVAAAISGGDIACLLIRHKDTDQLKKAAMAITGMAQEAGIAVLIDKNVDIAVACGGDGVQVDGLTQPYEQAYEQARAKLGDDKIIGVYCGSDRHSAMSLGEAGADYVAFSNTPFMGDPLVGAPLVDDPLVGGPFAGTPPEGKKEPIAHWWARVFEVPCVVVEPLEPQQAKEAIAGKVDFICPPETMWASEQAAQETVRLFNTMIKDTQIETNQS